MNKRCDWCGDDPLYVDYHDIEWGVPERNSRALWEKLILDGVSGWACLDHDSAKAREFPRGLSRVRSERDSGMGRSRCYPTAGRTLASCAIAARSRRPSATPAPGRRSKRIRALTKFLWAYVDGSPLINRPKTMADVPAESPLSQQVSKDLKKAGFKFCGPTIVYAFMQASGLINDHMVGCARHAEVQKL